MTDKHPLTAADYESVKRFLPRAMHELVLLIGIEAALELVRQKGGKKIPISKNMTEQGNRIFEDLAEMIGYKNAEKMSLAYGTQRYFFVPMCKQALAVLRNRAIIAEFDRKTMSGSTGREALSDLTDRYNLTERHIERIVSGVYEND